MKHGRHLLVELRISDGNAGNAAVIVDAIYKNPSLVNDFIRQAGAPAFDGFVRYYPASAWSEYALKGKAEADRVVRFAKRCPQGAEIIHAYIQSERPQPQPPGPTPTPPTPGPGGIPPRIWYGPVNGWLGVVQNEGGARKWVRAHAAAGVGICIEYMGPSAQFPSFYPTPWHLNPDAIFACYDRLLRITEAEGVWVWCIQHNHNAPTKGNPVSWHTEIAAQIIGRSAGKQVVYQPVSEYESSKSPGKRIETALQLFNYYESKVAKNAIMIWNGSSPRTRYQVQDYHVAHLSLTAPKRAGVTVVTSLDHSTVLADQSITPSEVMEGGTREGQRFRLDKLIPHVKAGLSVQPASWYNAYGFWHKTVDYAAIQALGQIAKALT